MGNYSWEQEAAEDRLDKESGDYTVQCPNCDSVCSSDRDRDDDGVWHCSDLTCQISFTDDEVEKETEDDLADDAGDRQFHEMRDRGIL